MDCVLDTTKNMGQFKQMFRMNAVHLENVKYLLKKLRAKAGEEERNEVGVISTVSFPS